MKTDAIRSTTAFRLLTCSIALYAAAPSAQAASVLVQAESFISTSGAGFSTPLDPTASGGSYATTLGDGTVGSPTDLAVYQVTFPSAGLYTLYIRALAEGTTSAEQIPNDSFFTPTTLGANPSFGGRLNSIELTTPDGVPLYHWINGNTGAGLEYGGTVDKGNPPNSNQYNVLAAGAQTFVIGGRENGLRLDAFVFSDDNNLSAAQLNTIAGIPEPTSVLLGAMGLLGLASRRRKQS